MPNPVANGTLQRRQAEVVSRPVCNIDWSSDPKAQLMASFAEAAAAAEKFENSGPARNNGLESGGNCRAVGEVTLEAASAEPLPWRENASIGEAGVGVGVIAVALNVSSSPGATSPETANLPPVGKRC